MAQDWTGSIPTVIYFIVGLGGLSGAILAMVKLWQTVVPDRKQQFENDVNAIKDDVHDIRSRVAALEIEVAKIDQPAIVKRFDGIEGKIDQLYKFLLDRFSDGAKDARR